MTLKRRAYRPYVVSTVSQYPQQNDVVVNPTSVLTTAVSQHKPSLLAWKSAQETLIHGFINGHSSDSKDCGRCGPIRNALADNVPVDVAERRST